MIMSKEGLTKICLTFHDPWTWVLVVGRAYINDTCIVKMHFLPILLQHSEAFSRITVYVGMISKEGSTKL